MQALLHAQTGILPVGTGVCTSHSLEVVTTKTYVINIIHFFVIARRLEYQL